MKRYAIIFIFTLLVSQSAVGQQISIIDSSQHHVSFRGLSVVSNTVLWVSGNKGTVGKSVDGGNHFNWMNPKGFETRDFRSVNAFDGKTAIIMAVDSPGVILKTIDSGVTWKVVYQNNLHGIFLDAMAFKNKLNGVCVGDPIDDHFWLIETNDGGDSWHQVSAKQTVEAKKGEACFASSGTNIQFIDHPDFKYGFVSGGMDARLFLINASATKPAVIRSLPLMKGLATTGANSLAVNGKDFVVVGGDFKNYTRNDSTIIYNSGGGANWNLSVQKPLGYKSCVIWLNNKGLIATGLSGSDITTNTIYDWKHFSDIPFNVVQKAKIGSAIFLAGGNGKIARIVF